MKHEVDMAVTVTVDVMDEDAIMRVLENHDDQGVPQPRQRGGSGWRDTMYDFSTRDEILAHFAYNAVANGVTDGSLLDGWGDLERGVVTMRVDAVDMEQVRA